ncbi:MAG: beta-galactosidase [Prevotella sp.]|jgi:beta-galactosidase
MNLIKKLGLHATIFFLLLLLLYPTNGLAKPGGSFTVGKGTFLLNGKPFVIKAAELHYPRIPRPYWEHRIKMCKALGMNTVCLYVFWNIHEPQEGQFDFTGNNDVAEFCRLAQKNGMYVIVRPGPYVCAEWEMGGLPWWLLKKKDIRLREQDPYFMQRVGIFEKKVAEQLEPLSIAHGGPIIMLQVENEYGSYGEDKSYVAAIRDTLRTYWFQGNQTQQAGPVLFQCDWASNFTKNALDDLVWTMNFGTGANIDQQFKRLGELRPDAPKMCSEFWSGWFDKWGARHETRPAKDMVEGIDEMLSKGISFSLYMTHGGTSWGHWAGANSPGFAPDVTSYDYDAPINEWGQPTPKYDELRATLEKYNNGKKLPAVPKSPQTLISVNNFKLKDVTSILRAASNVRQADHPLTFEDMDMGWGLMYYETKLPAIQEQSRMKVEAHDYAVVFINGKKIGTIDRVKNENSILLPPVQKGDQLVILVEGMGRINFGHAIKDYKGIVGDVTISMSTKEGDWQWTPRQWTMVTVPDNYQQLKNAFSAQASEKVWNGSDNEFDELNVGNGVVARYSFNLKKTGDTFINMEQWGKGQVYVNGHPLGRFWRIGPQQTLYCPGCWLKKGENELLILDIIGSDKGKNSLPNVWAQAQPELNKLQLEHSAKHNNIGDRPDLNSATPVFVGQAEDNKNWQTFRFSHPAQGRYVAFLIEGAQDKAPAAIAELYLNNEDGQRINRDQWKVKYATSENLMGNHTGDKAFDLQESTCWQTEPGVAFPHLLVIDMGIAQTVSSFDILPPIGNESQGRLGKFKVFVY